MGNLFKFIENAIFEQEEIPQETEKKEPQPQTAVRKQEQQQPAQPAQSASTEQSGPYSGTIRRHFAELISESVEQADIAGPDYRELKDAFDTEEMKQNIPDPTTRWKTCFSMMRMMDKGLTKQHILASIDVYTSVIDHEKRNALQQIEEKRNELVGKKSAAVAETEKRIKDAEDEIKKLQEKINKISERIAGDRTFIEQAKTEIAAGEAEINADKADLEVTAETIRKTLTDDKETLEAILPNDQ
jgi:hypothetical protein